MTDTTQERLEPDGETEKDGTINVTSLTVNQLSELLTGTEITKVTPEDIEEWIDDGLELSPDGNLNLIRVLAYLNKKMQGVK
jgi:hypothetical protein